MKEKIDDLQGFDNIIPGSVPAAPPTPIELDKMRIFSEEYELELVDGFQSMRLISKETIAINIKINDLEKEVAVLRKELELKERLLDEKERLIGVLLTNK